MGCAGSSCSSLQQECFQHNPFACVLYQICNCGGIYDALFFGFAIGGAYHLTRTVLNIYHGPPQPVKDKAHCPPCEDQSLD